MDTLPDLETDEPDTTPKMLTVPPFGTRVLLADDDFEMRETLAAALCADGYDVVRVRDGGELLLHLEATFLGGRTEDKYDIVISDIRMPVCSGLQVLEGMRRARWMTPIILMTAFGDEPTRTQVESQGAVLLDKPFDLDDFRSAVVKMIRSNIGDSSVPPKQIIGQDNVLVLVASTSSNLEAWSIKWVLQSEGIQTFLGGHALISVAEKTEVYVLKADETHARSVLARLEPQLEFLS